MANGEWRMANRMNRTIGLAIGAVVLLVAGGALWSAGGLEAQLAAAHRELASLRYGAIDETHALVAEAIDNAWPLPVVTARQRADLHRQVIAARYWRGEYAGLQPERDETGVPVETDVEIMLVTANAAYRRATSSESRAITLAGLDEALRQYADVLRAAPGHTDAAYNYEFAARLRASLAGDRASDVRRMDDEEEPRPPGDLPDGPTLHGRPGAPPPGTDMRQFQMVIPMSPDERRAVPERSGEGDRPRRKG
jgi:hypothetical protein